MKKGLRHAALLSAGEDARNTDRPDEEGIKTAACATSNALWGNTDRPDEEGIKTLLSAGEDAIEFETQTDLMKKGLRPML